MTVHINLSIDNDQLASVNRLLVDILTRVKRLELATGRLEAQGVANMATAADVQAKLDALHADLEDETNVVQSVELLLTSNTEQIKQLRADLATAIANGSDPQVIVDQLDALIALQADNKARTVAAVVANTPAAPPPA